MSALKDLLVSASVAVGNVASRERDRDMALTHDDGRPRAIEDRARGRIQAVVTEGAAKLVVSQTAHIAARELAKRIPGEAIKHGLKILAKQPAAAASTALFAFDAARDGYRLVRGEIDRDEFLERVGGNTAGLAGAAGGAYVGSFVGTLAMPVIGTAIGSVVGGVVGGIGGDTYGRRRVRAWMGTDEEIYEDDEIDDDLP